MSGTAPLSIVQRQALLEAEGEPLRLLAGVSRKVALALETRLLVDSVGRLTARGHEERERALRGTPDGGPHIDAKTLARLDAEILRGEVPFRTLAKRFHLSPSKVRARANLLGVSAPRRSVLALGLDPG